MPARKSTGDSAIENLPTKLCLPPSGAAGCLTTDATSGVAAPATLAINRTPSGHVHRYIHTAASLGDITAQYISASEQ